LNFYFLGLTPFRFCALALIRAFVAQTGAGMGLAPIMILEELNRDFGYQVAYSQRIAGRVEYDQQIACENTRVSLFDLVYAGYFLFQGTLQLLTAIQALHLVSYAPGHGVMNLL
jgi:hypothetical protein